jgi:hypothetical protein
MGLALREGSSSWNKVIELELWRKLLLSKSMLKCTLAIEHAVSEFTIKHVLSRGGALGYFLNQSALAIEFIVSIITSERWCAIGECHMRSYSMLLVAVPQTWVVGKTISCLRISSIDLDPKLVSHQVHKLLSCFKRLIFSCSDRYIFKVVIDSILILDTLIGVFTIVNRAIWELKAFEVSLVHGFEVICSVHNFGIGDDLWLRVFSCVRHLFYLKWV